MLQEATRATEEKEANEKETAGELELFVPVMEEGKEVTVDRWSRFSKETTVLASQP